MKVKFKNGDEKFFDKVDTSDMDLENSRVALNDEEGNIIAIINVDEVLYMEE